MFQRQSRKDKEAHIHKICAEIEEENRVGHSRELFKKLRSITGKFTPKVGNILDHDGEQLTEETEVKQRWRQYTEDLYKIDPNITEMYMADDNYEKEPDILASEERKALQEIKNSKSPSCDNIPIELIKAAGEEGIKIMTILCNKIWNTGKWPTDWKKSIYIPIPKKGDARECSNNRTIALISHTSKVLLKIIQSRMEQYVERELSDVQAGFRKIRSPTLDG